MAEGLLLFYYFPNTSQSASLTAPLKGSLPQCLPLKGGAAGGGGEVADLYFLKNTCARK